MLQDTAEGQAVIPLPFLVQQHKEEILDANADYTRVCQLTFNKEFQNMLSVCLFVPFMHRDTPKPFNLVKE